MLLKVLLENVLIMNLELLGSRRSNDGFELTVISMA